ncbi:abortive infection system antitoxin AbiGi family protein [Microbulbifer sp. JTAC008]|uniref:abortive infection system antitoxin AbiGi family protein n=1 Tax=Microbulbifer sp. JTAC008 TaxID=3243374 RepID=UPI0040390B26
MKPKTDNLFHFTKSLDVLQLILKNGIQPRYCLEDIEWFGAESDKHIAFPMSCFCDIPLSRIYEHTDFYGNFGLGLTKSWGYKNGLNPVIYSPEGGVAQSLAKYLFYFNNVSDAEHQRFSDHLFEYWSIVKPVNGKMLVSGSFVEKEFYQENEWRFVPPVTDLLYQEQFEDKKERANKEIEKFSLEMSPSDIKYIFVRSDSDIPQLVDFINTELGRFPLNDLKILLSRIVSLETLKKDL